MSLIIIKGNIFCRNGWIGIFLYVFFSITDRDGLVLNCISLNDTCICNDMERSIFNCSSGKTSTPVKRTVWCQSRLQEIPPEQITSYSMSPMHRSPFIAVRMILKKQMAFIIEKRKTIRVVYPSTGRCQMESRSF